MKHILEETHAAPQCAHVKQLSLRNHGSRSDLAISRTLTLESRPQHLDPPPYLKREIKYSPGESSLSLLNRAGEAIERAATRRAHHDPATGLRGAGFHIYLEKILETYYIYLFMLSD